MSCYPSKRHDAQITSKWDKKSQGRGTVVVREDVWLHKTEMECTLYRRRAGSPSLALLSIIGAWLLAYFFKGALIRGPSAIWRAAHLNFTSEGWDWSPLPCPEVVPPPHHAILGLPRLPTATASRPICKFDCPWSTGLLAGLGRHIFKDACRRFGNPKMQVHKCKGFQISHAFVVHEIPHMEEALDRCIYAVHPPAAGVASRRRLNWICSEWGSRVMELDSDRSGRGRRADGR